MTLTEKRVRAGLEAEARAIATAASSTPSHKRPRFSGAAIALASAVVVLVVFGGVAILVGVDRDVLREDLVIPPSVSSPDATTPFETIPFRADGWLVKVTEEPNPSLGTYNVCYRFEPTNYSTCSDWPTDDPGFLLGVESAMWTETGVVLLLDLTHNPVDRVNITGAGVNETLTPFVFPGSGKQLVVAEVPDTAGRVNIEVLGSSGAVLDRAEGVDVTSAKRAAVIMGGEDLSDQEPERLTGWPIDMANSGYLIESMTAPGGVYELGLLVYQEDPVVEDGEWTCFSPFAIIQDVNVAGGAICADTPHQVTEIAAFHLSISGSCGAFPKEDPVVEGVWTMFAVWGLPDTAGVVTVGLSDDSTVDVEAPSGVALYLWEESVDIVSIEFDDMTEPQRDRISSYLPAHGIGSDCGRSDTRGG